MEAAWLLDAGSFGAGSLQSTACAAGVGGWAASVGRDIGLLLDLAPVSWQDGRRACVERHVALPGALVFGVGFFPLDRPRFLSPSWKSDGNKPAVGWLGLDDLSGSLAGWQSSFPGAS